VSTALNMMAKSNARSFLVGNDGLVSGLVSRAQVERQMRHSDNMQIGALAASDCRHVHPDHSLAIVIERLGKNPGLLPVVARSDDRRVVGVITPEALMQFVQRNSIGEEAVHQQKPAA
jgi:CBS domain-containing protein